MDNDIRTEFERITIDGGGEGVVDDKRNTVRMCLTCELFNVKHDKRGICESLCKYSLSIRLEGRRKLFLCDVGVNEGCFDAHALHGDSDKIEASTVDRRGCDDMVACSEYGEQREEGCRLTG